MNGEWPEGPSRCAAPDMRACVRSMWTVYCLLHYDAWWANNWHASHGRRGNVLAGASMSSRLALSVARRPIAQWQCHPISQICYLYHAMLWPTALQEQEVCPLSNAASMKSARMTPLISFIIHPIAIAMCVVTAAPRSLSPAFAVLSHPR
jgi:hypothetical protein